MSETSYNPKDPSSHRQSALNIPKALSMTQAPSPPSNACIKINTPDLQHSTTDQLDGSTIAQEIRKPTVIIKKRFRLPWLDGNANSRQMPGTFNPHEYSDGTSSAEPQRPSTSGTGIQTPVADEKSVLTRLDPSFRPYSSTQSLGQIPRRPDRRTWSLASDARPPGPSKDTYKEGLLVPPGQYTPSAYSDTPPSEQDMPSTLPRKDPASYEKLVDKSKPPTWPLVPLSELEIPARISSLSFREPESRPSNRPGRSRSEDNPSRSKSPASIGRYNDGTISRRPTVRTRTMSKPQSPAISPKTISPSLPSSADAGGNKSGSSLESAVTGLQDLMHEALTVAKEAARQDQGHEVAQILNEATLALRKAATVHDQIAEPLQLTESEIGASSSDDYIADSDSDADVESEISSIHSRRHGSDETAPTMYTYSKSGLSMRLPAIAPFQVDDKPSPLVPAVGNPAHPGDHYFMPLAESQQPTVSPPFQKDGKLPRSRHVSIDDSHPTNIYLSSSSADRSIGQTPPTMYQSPSVDSIATDWAYVKRVPGRRDLKDGAMSQPSQSPEQVSVMIPPAPTQAPGHEQINVIVRNKPSQAPEVDIVVQPANLSLPEIPKRKSTIRPPRTEEQSSTEPVSVAVGVPAYGTGNIPRKRTHPQQGVGRIFESPYYHLPAKEEGSEPRKSRYDPLSGLTSPDLSLRHPRRHHISLKENQTFRLHRYRRQPIAREWHKLRKRVTAAIACFNTLLVGLIAGIYAGEVPKIQYQLADEHHRVILGNVVLYIGMGITTLICWPLPLLHGRKPYTLAALAITLALQFPQTIMVSTYRSPETRWFVGLLLPRAFAGLALGFANINFLTTLFDMFGASLQSMNPHQEIVVYDDIRRQGGGMGLWLGIWSWCFVGSLSVGFLIGAGITAHLNPAWGFYLVVILLALSIIVNVVTPETRRAPYRRSILKYLDEDEKLRRRIARGEVKLHISMDGPKYWYEEVWAGIKLMGYMLLQPGLLVLTFYLAWIYALVVLVTLLLGALLSRDYRWPPQFVGLAVFALAVGALLAVPLSKANIFSRDRIQPARTDSMTFQPRVTWTSHLVRRCIFTFALPIVGVIYLLTSPGPSVSWAAPIIMSALVGFLSCLAIAECIGLLMETFDTSDLQPGVNTKHRLQSMESATRRRRTNYSSFPRVTAGLFIAQGFGFFFAAASTGVSGAITRAVGAQAATGIVIAILLFATILLSIVLWRFKSVQVIPNHALGTRKSSAEWNAPDAEHDDYWQPVIIGNPSGKMRRMNTLEMGAWTRWTEIRKLNKLIKHKK